MLESFGTVAKEERVKTVENHILPNSLVLENLEIFPGYHGENLPTDQGPDTFFLITTESHSAEKIFRLSHEIRTFSGYSFDGSPAKLCIGNDSYDAIRIRDLKSYDPLEELQRCFHDAGIHFMKHKHVEGTALIELKKIISFEAVSNDISKDIDGKLYYLDIRKQISWGRFKSVTRWVKNNFEDQNFDAALVVVYAKDVYDLVRIYDPNPSPDRLEKIRQKYLDGIQRTE